MNIVIHHNDPDGWCSAHLVNLYAGPCKFIEVQYGQNFDIVCEAGFTSLIVDETSHRIDVKDKVWIVDFSLSHDLMIALNELVDLIWIDHHASIIKDMADYKIEGIQSVDDAACALTYMYLEEKAIYDKFDLGREMHFILPDYVKLIADYDSWHWQDKDYSGNRKNVRNFQYGVRHLHAGPDGYPWIGLERGWDAKDGTLVNDICDIGEIISDSEEARYKQAIKDLAWISEYRIWTREPDIDMNDIFLRDFGESIDVPVIAMNGPKSSMVWGELFDEHPDTVFVSYSHDGQKFKVSLRSKNIDVSKIAKNFGGGGHRGAAGFETEKMPFKYINKLK